MNIRVLLKDNLFFILVIVFSIFAILPFFKSGFFIVHDDTQVARIYEMGKTLSDGMFPPRWVSDLGYGFGYPIFNFYAPLPYLVGAFFLSLGFNVLIATKLVFVAVLLASAISMFFLVKTFFGKEAGLVSSIVYMYFPYHAVNTYVRGDLSEAAAYAFLPLVFLGLSKTHYMVLKKENPKAFLAITAISLALVILSHNLSAFMLFIFVFLFIIFSIIAGKFNKKLIFTYLLVLLIAFLLSAFYSLPAVFEMRFTNVDSLTKGGSLFSDHFVCPSQLWNSEWGFGGSTKGCIDGMSFKLGKINILAAVLAFSLFIVGFKRMKHKLFVSLSFVCLFISFFLMLNYSNFIWKLPFMEFLQFPWRFLNFSGLFLSIIIGFLFWQARAIFSRNKVFIFIFIFITIFYNAKLFAPQGYTDRSAAFYTQDKYLKWTVSKISDEYLSKNFTKPKSPENLRDSVLEIVGGKGSVLNYSHKTQRSSVQLSLSEKSQIRANIAFFPAWEIRVDGKKTSYVAKDDGLYLNIPSGSHTLTAEFVETPVERIGNAVSLIGVLALLIVIIGKLDIIYGQKTS